MKRLCQAVMSKIAHISGVGATGQQPVFTEVDGTRRATDGGGGVTDGG